MAALLLGGALGACAPEPDLELPSASELEGLYGSRASLRLNGNVVEVDVEQDPRQLERGGPLWARVGPYIYLFSPQTRDVFQQYSGVAAVRVRTRTPGGEEVARAMLHRDELSSLTWPDAIQRVARARKEGTERPGYLENLVEFGEDRTTHEYNARYVK